MLVSITSLMGRGGLSQSMPVVGLRCTLSTSSDHNTIGTEQDRIATKAASGPTMPKARAIAVHRISPASPANPTPALTAERGRGSAAAGAGGGGGMGGGAGG